MLSPIGRTLGCLDIGLMGDGGILLQGVMMYVMNYTHAFWRQGVCDELSHQVVDVIHDRRLKKLNSQHHNWIYVPGLISLVTE